MAFNYSKLKGKIVEKCGTQAKFASLLEISERSLSLKLNSAVPWRQTEMERACFILGIDGNEIGLYFFTREV